MLILRSATCGTSQRRQVLIAVLAVVALCAAPLVSEAALQSRGPDMVYDDATNLTWVTNTHLGFGSAFDDGFSPTDGRMSYAAAQAWVSQLELGVSDNGPVIGDWGLPSAGALAILSGHSELFNLLYGTLANTPGALLTNTGPFGSIPGSLANPSGFFWLDSYCEALCKQHYASISINDSVLTVEGHLLGGKSFDLALAILPSEGFEGPAVSQPGSQAMYGYAWAVRTGDVATVPIPSPAILFALGGLTILPIARLRTS